MILQKKQVNDILLDFEFEIRNNEVYKVYNIYSSIVYAKKLIIKQLLRLYYLVL